MKEVSMMKSILDAVTAIVEECKIKFTQTGLSIAAIDDGRFCMFILEIPKTDFDSYQAVDCEIGINIADLNTIVKRARDKDSLELKYDDDQYLKIILTDGSDDDNHRRKFKLQLIDLGDSGIKPETLDSMEFNRVTIYTSAFEEAIKDADIFSEVIIISLNASVLSFKSEGQFGDMEAEFEEEDKGVENFYFDITNVISDLPSAFPLSYFKKVLRAKSLHSNIELGLLNSSPIKMNFRFLGNSRLTFWIAPRIEEEIEEEE